MADSLLQAAVDAEGEIDKKVLKRQKDAARKREKRAKIAREDPEGAEKVRLENRTAARRHRQHKRDETLELQGKLTISETCHSTLMDQYNNLKAQRMRLAETVCELYSPDGPRFKWLTTTRFGSQTNPAGAHWEMTKPTDMNSVQQAPSQQHHQQQQQLVMNQSLAQMALSKQMQMQAPAMAPTVMQEGMYFYPPSFQQQQQMQNQHGMTLGGYPQGYADLMQAHQLQQQQQQQHLQQQIEQRHKQLQQMQQMQLKRWPQQQQQQQQQWGAGGVAQWMLQQQQQFQTQQPAYSIAQPMLQQLTGTGVSHAHELLAHSRTAFSSSPKTFTNSSLSDENSRSEKSEKSEKSSDKSSEQSGRSSTST